MDRQGSPSFVEPFGLLYPETFHKRVTPVTVEEEIRSSEVLSGRKMSVSDIYRIERIIWVISFGLGSFNKVLEVLAERVHVSILDLLSSAKDRTNVTSSSDGIPKSSHIMEVKGGIFAQLKCRLVLGGV